MNRLRRLSGYATPSWVFYGTVLFLLFSFLGIYLIDIANLFGLRDELGEIAGVGYFWYWWFDSPLKNPLRFFLLASAVIIHVFNSAKAHEQGDGRVFKMWLLMGIGCMLMLIEDAAGVRHVLRRRLQVILSDFSFTAEGGYGFFMHCRGRGRAGKAVRGE